MFNVKKGQRDGQVTAWLEDRIFSCPQPRPLAKKSCKL